MASLEGAGTWLTDKPWLIMANGQVDYEKGCVKVAYAIKDDPTTSVFEKWVDFDSEEICRCGVHIKPKIANNGSPTTPSSYPANSDGSGGSHSRTISTRSSN